MALIYEQPICETSVQSTLENYDILRARGLLLRAVATPKQRDAEFKAALASLAVPNENGYKSLLYQAFSRNENLNLHFLDGIGLFMIDSADDAGKALSREAIASCKSKCTEDNMGGSVE